MILLIDNYDSFTYNLYQLVGTICPDIVTIRNDAKTVSEIRVNIAFRQEELLKLPVVSNAKRL